jgi:putative phosphoesterase
MRRLGDISLAWTKEHVAPENKAFLRSLLPQIRLEVNGKRVLMVHGSPRKINEYLYEDRGQASLERIAKGADADVLVFGHTHLPYVKEVAGVLFVNTGSAGKPKDRDVRAAYAVIDFGQEVAVAIRRVAYDVPTAAAAVRASGLPPHFAELLETGRG